jgi:hypothetical protein
LQEAEKQVHMVGENLRIAQSRQKSYADQRRRELSFEVGDFVYLKESPMRGLRRFMAQVKLAPRFIGPLKTKFPSFFFDPFKSRGRYSF